MDTNRPISSEVVAFLQDRRARQLSPNTIEFYRSHLELFSKHMTAMNVVNIRDVTPNHLREFLLKMSEHRSPGGVHAAWRSVKALFNWYKTETGWESPVKKVSAPKVPQNTIPGIPLEDVHKLLDTCDKSFSGQRDKALIMFLLDTGLRKAEVLSINMMDVDTSTGSVTLHHGKGGKARVVFIGKNTARELHRYIRLWDATPLSPLWITQKGSRLTPDGLRQIIRRRCNAAGINDVGLHAFRRTFAIQCLRNGMDIFTLMRIMGHSSPAVLSKYLALTHEDLRERHGTASPVDKL